MRIASRLAPRLARPLSMSSLTVAPTNLGKSVVTKSEPMQDGRWIGLRRLDWTDQEGRQRAWEMAERKTTGSGGVDAVAIVGVLNQPGKERSIPIILQYARATRLRRLTGQISAPGPGDLCRAPGRSD